MEDSKAGEILCISCENKVYALDFVNVDEICVGMEISKIPSLPEYFVGVCNNRGEIIPIISMSGKGNSYDDKKDTIILIVKNNKYKFAILLEREPYIIALDGLTRVESHVEEVESGIWVEREIWKSDTEIISVVDVERTIDKLILYK